MWTPAQARTAATTPDRGMSASALGAPGSMLGSAAYSLNQQSSVNQMSSQSQRAASQLAAPQDAALHNPLAVKQLMLQVGSCKPQCHAGVARMNKIDDCSITSVTSYELSQLLIYCASDSCYGSYLLLICKPVNG